MIYDGLIAIAFIALCLAGWNVGIVNSWRGPIAMVIATVVTQQFYIDFGTWICQQTLIKPNFCAFLSYLMMWLVVDIVTEIIMGLVLTFNRKERPVAFERIAAVGLAMVRWTIIVTFPLMAMIAPNKIPVPPKYDDGLINPLSASFDESRIITAMAGVSKGMLPTFGPAVISNKPPSFKPNFERTKVNLE